MGKTPQNINNKNHKNSIINNSTIKHLKPKQNSKYHQGYINPAQLKKYYDSCRNEPVIYRSELELKFIQFCEGNPNIKKWASEPIAIPYFNKLASKERNYYPDYIIENEKGEKTIVEVKPDEQTHRPSENDSRWLKEQWITNVDKWTAAKKFADSNNMKFIIITEKFFK